MKDIITVTIKELREATGERLALQGSLLQSAIVVGMCGIFVPIVNSNIWFDASATLPVFVMFPAIIASSVAADSFAGERERRTLDTLLATPISDSSLYLGKIAAAVSFSFCIAVVSVLTSLVVVAASRGLSVLVSIDPSFVAGVLIGTLSCGILAAGIGVFISARLPVVRSAQQVSAMVVFGVLGAVFGLLQHAGMSALLSPILVLDSSIFVLALVSLVFGLRRFKREYLFDTR